MQVKEQRLAQGEGGRRGESRGLQTRQLNKAVKGERESLQTAAWGRAFLSQSEHQGSRKRLTVVRMVCCSVAGLPTGIGDKSGFWFSAESVVQLEI